MDCMVTGERDGRAMSRMDAESKEVHLRLEVWGRWAYDGSIRPFPELSILGRMIKYGALGAAQEGRPPISMPDEIATTDAAVARLCWIDRRAIVTYYTREDPIESCAKRCRMGVRQFQNVLRRARWRVKINLIAHND